MWTVQATEQAGSIRQLQQKLAPNGFYKPVFRPYDQTRTRGNLCLDNLLSQPYLHGVSETESEHLKLMEMPVPDSRVALNPMWKYAVTICHYDSREAPRTVALLVHYKAGVKGLLQQAAQYVGLAESEQMVASVNAHHSMLRCSIPQHQPVRLVCSNRTPRWPQHATGVGSHAMPIE